MNSKRIALWITAIIMIASTILLAYSSTASAYSANTFNNSLTSELLTFSGNSNITRFLEITSGVNRMTTARLNLTGFATSSAALKLYYPLENYTESVDGIYNLSTGNGTYKPAVVNNGLFRSIINTQADLPINLSSNADYSVCLWVNISGKTGAILGFNNKTNQDYSTTGQLMLFTSSGTNTLQVGLNDYNELLTIPTPPTNVWSYYCMVKNQTELVLYKNATKVASHTLVTSWSGITKEINLNNNNVSVNNNLLDNLNNSIDEISVWQSALTSNDIVTLYNNSFGLNYTSIQSIFLLNSSIIYIGNESVDVTGLSANGTIPVTKNANLLSIINSYLNLNCPIGSCDIPFVFHSDFAGNLNYSDLVFSNLGFTENSQTFNATTQETSLEGFAINISYDSVYYTLASATLNYNGTSYLGTKSGTGNTVVFDRSITIPTVTSSTTKSFYWTIALTNSTSTTYINSTSNSQTINPINITNCLTGGTLAFNFTASDEQTLARIIPFSFKATFNVWSGDGSIRKNITFSNISTAEQLVCITPASSIFTTDAYIEYDDANTSVYSTRNYYLVHNSMNNQTQNFSLYLLNNSASTSFIENLLDSNNLPIPSYYIYSQRYYPGENTWRTVQIGKTDDSGNSIGFFETEIPDYRFLIYDSDAVLKLSTIPQKVVPTAVPYTLYFTLGSSAQTPWTLFQNKSGFSYSGPTLNNATHIISYSYEDTSGNISYVRMVVSTTNYTGRNGILCDVNSTAPIGVLTCDITGTNTGTVEVAIFLSRSPETPISLTLFILNSLASSMGRLGYFLGWLIILSCAMVGLYNPTAGILLTNMGIWVVSLIGFISFGPIWTFAILAISIFLISELNT